MNPADRPTRPRDPSSPARLDAVDHPAPQDPAAPAPADDDPTGVQRLLSTLPDPGPMPPDLVERITASLREEAARRERDPHVTYGLFTDGSRRRRPPWFKAAAAAAVVAVGAGGVAFVGRDAADNLAGLSTFAGLSSTATDDAAERISPSASSAAATPTVERGHASFVMSGTAYTAPTLRAKAEEMAHRSLPSLHTPQAEAPYIGPIATPIGLASCLRALGLPDDARAVVDLASYDARPAVVIVTHAGDHDQVHVVRRECSETEAHLIAGPYPLS